MIKKYIVFDMVMLLQYPNYFTKVYRGHSEDKQFKEGLKTFVVSKTFDGTKFREMDIAIEKGQKKETVHKNPKEFKENQDVRPKTRRSFGGVSSRQLQEKSSLLNVIPVNIDEVETDVLTSAVSRVKKLQGKKM